MASLTHWHILGAGSIGCLWAYYLRKAGHSVTLITRDTARQHTLHNALPITLLKNHKTYYSGDIQTSSPGEPGNRQAGIQHLMICLKAWQTADALTTIAPLLHPHATVVLMQNGMGNQQLLLDTLPKCAIYAGITTEAACKRNAYTVEHTGTGSTQLGASGRITDPSLPEKLACDLAINLHPDIEAALWQKLVVNCCINPLTVIYRCKNGELAHNAEALQKIRAIIDECKKVSHAMGKAHYLDGIEQMVADVVQKTAMNTSSMLQDVLQHRPTEIDYINGYISGCGKQHAIATPANDHIIHYIKTGEHHA